MENAIHMSEQWIRMFLQPSIRMLQKLAILFLTGGTEWSILKK